jgi:PAS domain S-box-containing protein
MAEQKQAKQDVLLPLDRPLRILLLEDNEYDGELILQELHLSKMRFESIRVETRDAFLDALDTFAPDLILADFSLPSFDGIAALEIVRSRDPVLPFIFVSGALGEELAIDLLKKGATDYVIKDRLSRLVPSVQRAQAETEGRRLRKQAEEERDLLLRELESRVLARTDELRREIEKRKRTGETLRRSEARFRLLSETAGRLLAAEDPHGLIDSLCRKVMEHLDCQAFFNFMVDERAGRLRLNACAGIPAAEVRKLEWLDYGVAVCGCVARDGARIIAEDIFHTPDARTELVKSYGIQAYCCHLMKIQDRLIGTLSFGTKTRARFTLDEVELMRTVADQVAITLQRIQANREISEAEKRFRGLADAMPQLVWTAGTDGRIDYFNRRLTEFSHQEGMKAAIHPEDWLRTREAWQRGIQSGKGYEIEHRLRRADGSFRWFLSRAVPVCDDEGRVIRWYGTSTDVNDQKQAEQSLRVSVDELEHKVRERTAELVSLLTELEKSRDDLRKLASELVLAEERERRRIATVLHDEICQTLAVARMRVDMLQRMAADEQSSKTVQEAKDFLVRSIQETRALMNDLGNPLLFDMGIAAACESLADRLMGLYPIQICCDIRDSFKDLDPEVKVFLFQVIRELLNNVIKHSGARNAQVLIRVHGGRIQATVKDDGMGFDPQMLGTPTAEGGFGLFSIRERLMAFSGDLSIESDPQKGTTVTASLPSRLERPLRYGNECSE